MGGHQEPTLLLPSPGDTMTYHKLHGATWQPALWPRQGTAIWLSAQVQEGLGVLTLAMSRPSRIGPCSKVGRPTLAPPGSK